MGTSKHIKFPLKVTVYSLTSKIFDVSFYIHLIMCLDSVYGCSLGGTAKDDSFILYGWCSGPSYPAVSQKYPA